MVMIQASARGGGSNHQPRASARGGGVESPTQVRASGQAGDAHTYAHMSLTGGRFPALYASSVRIKPRPSRGSCMYAVVMASLAVLMVLLLWQANSTSPNLDQSRVQNECPRHGTDD